MHFHYLGEPNIERLLRAFRGEEIDRVPFFETLIESDHVKKILGRKAGSNLHRFPREHRTEKTLDVHDSDSLGEEELEDIPMRPEDYVELCKATGQDAMIIPHVMTPFKKRDKEGRLVRVRDRSVKSKKDFDSLIFPGEEDIQKVLGYIREYRKAAEGTKIGLTTLSFDISQTLYEFVVGFNDFMMMIYENPSFVNYMLEVSFEYWTKYMKAIVEGGIDFIYIADDVAFRNGLFVPPKIWKKMWGERLKQLIEPAKDANIPILFHSDGKIDDIIPWLIDMGVDCINPMDPYCIDYRDYKKRFGDKISLSGNIDVEFPLAKGTPKDVEENVKAHMEVLKPGYRYVACSSHSIVNYIPFENFQAMVNAIFKYGVYQG